MTIPHFLYLIELASWIYLSILFLLMVSIVFGVMTLTPQDEENLRYYERNHSRRTQKDDAEDERVRKELSDEEMLWIDH